MPLPFSETIREDIFNAAAVGAPSGAVTYQLQQLGYTMADIASLYGQVASATPLTPQVMDYLQRENAYLADEMAKQYRMWVLIFAGAFGFYLYSRRQR